MSDLPAILIEFDPVTWEVAALYFKANNDEQTQIMQAILAKGMRTAARTGEVPSYVS